MKDSNFFAELKRRNVYKVAVAYAVVGWLLIQVATQVFPFFEIPNWAVRLVVLLIAVGFPISLVIAWAFEMTPEGIKRTEAANAEHEHSRGKTWIYVVVVAAGISIALFFLGRYTVETPRPASAELRAGGQMEPAAIPEKSIAVLPLAIEGGAKDDQYFSDGLSEDLITALSQFANLKVIGRNSSFQFRDSQDDSKTIGAKLGVAHLLEGSVRRAADAVRISAELVNAADGTTVWSQHYDRPYKDLFKLQDDITTAVATALKAKLLNPNDPAAQSDRPPSGSLEAYNAFLKGNFHFQHSTKDALRQAIDSYQTAVSLDSKYAQAYAAMGSAQTFYGDYFSGAEAQQNFAMARASINTALILNPDLAGAHQSHALLLAFADLDFVGAKTEFERAVELAPNNLDAVACLAQMRAAFGHPEAAIEPIRQTLANDPRNAGWYGLLANDLMAVGRLDEAEEATRQQIDLGGAEEIVESRLSKIEVLRGNVSAALQKAEQLPPGKGRDLALARARQIGNDPAAASAALQTLIDHYANTDAYYIAGVYALRRDPDGMFAWLDRAWVNRENSISTLYYDPFLLRYKDDPRFAAFCRKVGLPTPAEVAVSKP